MVGDENNVDSGYPKKIQMGHLGKCRTGCVANRDARELLPEGVLEVKPTLAEKVRSSGKPGGGWEEDTNAGVYGNLLGLN